MNKLAQLQYLSDSKTIDLLCSNSMVKNAGILDALGLSGSTGSSVGGSILSFVKDKINPDNPGGYVGSVLSLMVPAVLFRINPFLGVANAIASQFGFGLEDIVPKVVGFIKSELSSKGQVSESSLSSFGKSLAMSMGGDSSSANDSLHSLACDLDLFKLARYSDSILDNIPKTPFLFGGKSSYGPTSILTKIFGSLRLKGKLVLIIVGIIVWTLKTMLAGAGLLAGASAITSLVGLDKYKKDDKEYKPEQSKQELQDNHQETQSEYSGYRREETKKEPTVERKDLWVVPLIGNKTIEDTLYLWTVEFYPHLESVDKNLILNDYSFKDTVRVLKDPEKIGRDRLVMPQKFSTRKQVVDTFVDDLNRNFKNEI